MSQTYQGGELDLFADANRWKGYFGALLRQYIGGRVLEVGAGIGANVPFLHHAAVAEWTCLEPDPQLAERIEQGKAAGAVPPDCRVVVGTTTALDPGAAFDTILYIDVLEHIADDAGELARARRHLASGGHLVVLAPAHEFLFSPFDAAIGHYRRYSRSRLLGLAPPRATPVFSAMLDSAGLFASLANRSVLSQRMPTRRQVAFWDAWLVPLSRRLDPLVGRRFGKTVVAVWQATG